MGKEKGYVLYDEVSEVLPGDLSTGGDLDDILAGLAAGAMLGPSSSRTSVETSDPAPLAARNSPPAWVVTIKVRMPRVRKTALVRSILPVPLTTTWSGGAFFWRISDR